MVGVLFKMFLDLFYTLYTSSLWLCGSNIARKISHNESLENLKCSEGLIKKFFVSGTYSQAVVMPTKIMMQTTKIKEI